MKHITRFYVLMMVVLLIVASACKKDDDDDKTPTPTPTPTLKTTVSGIVTDENNIPLQGVRVKVEGTTAPVVITNNTGSYHFSQITTTQRVSLTFSKPNFYNVTRSETRTSSGVLTINGTMISKNSQISTTNTISAATGGDVVLPLNNSKVSLPANGFVDQSGAAYNGMVNVSLAYLDPTADNFDELIPGGDMIAQNTNNETGILISYGIIKVELTDMAGNPLQLGGGKPTAEITVYVPSSMLAEAPATIPLWYFDELKGRWIEEGSAVLAGSHYVGTVTHFTDWNCDVWEESQATITGTVSDANGNPVAGVTVKTGQTSAVTNSNGVYSRVVPSGVPITVRIQNYFGYSESKPAGSLSPGQTKTVNFNVPQANFITGNLLNCSGTPIAGTVGILWGNNLEKYSSTYTANGVFSVPIYPDNSSVFIYGYANNAYFSKTFWPMFDNDGKYELDLLLCDIATGENKITLNGGIYNNQTFSNFNEENIGVYEEFNEGGQIWFNTRISSKGSDGEFSFSFEGKTTGTYANVYMHLSLGATLNFYIQNASITVTKYGNVGQLIEGTFNGSTNISGQNVSITGSFSVIRHPDENQGW